MFIAELGSVQTISVPYYMLTLYSVRMNEAKVHTKAGLAGRPQNRKKRTFVCMYVERFVKRPMKTRFMGETVYAINLTCFPNSIIILNMKYYTLTPTHYYALS